MKRKLTAGLTSASLPIYVRDTSSATGAGLASLLFNTAGLVAEYRRQGSATWTAITLAAGTLGTWASGGIIADGALTGAYELNVPDAALASGARWVAIRLRGAANMLPVLIEIELDVVNYQSATAFITSVGGVAGNVGGVSGVTFPAIVGNSNYAGGAADTNAAAIKAKTDLIATNGADSPNTTTEQATVTGIRTDYTTAKAAFLDAAVSGVPTATLDLANGIETGITLRQCMRLLTAVLAGKATDSSGTYTLKRQDGTTTAVTVVHDSAGNRTSVTIGTL